MSFNLNNNFNTLFESIKNQFSTAIESLKEKKIQIEDSINFKFSWIEDEIDIKIESIKNELDRYADDLKYELYELKQSYINHDLRSFEIFQTHDYERKLANFQAYINDNSTEHDLVKYKNELEQDIISIEQKLNSISYSDLEIKLECNSDLCNAKTIIGNLYLKTNIETKLITNRYKTIELGSEIDNICMLKNGLLVSSSKSNCLNMYDFEFKLVKSVHILNNEMVEPYFATSNQENRIYISDTSNNRLIMTDGNLNFLKYSKVNALKSCFGTCFHDGYLYVCDYDASKLVKFDADLDTYVAYELDRKPWYVQILNNTCCVRDKQGSQYSFTYYDLKTFKIIARYEYFVRSSFIFQNHFFQLANDKKKFNIYNEQGTHVKSVDTSLFHSFDSKYGFDINLLNDYLLISSDYSNKLIVV